MEATTTVSQVTVTIEDTLTTALARLGDAADARLMALAKTTADEFQAEVQSRLRRQLSGGGTGLTVSAITTGKTEGGYRVTSGEMGGRPANLPIWLEYGTKHMAPKPAWDATRLLMAGTYLRRVEDTLQQAIDGLGGA